MSWALEDHTADVRLRVEAADWARLLVEATRCFGEYVGGVAVPPEGTIARAIDVEGIDAAETWVRYWRALLRLWTVEALLPVGAQVEPGATELHVRARIECAQAEALDLGACQDVKAVTWHGAQAAPTRSGWIGQVVLDL